MSEEEKNKVEDLIEEWKKEAEQIRGEIMNIKQALIDGSKMLKDNGVGDSNLISKVLMADILKKTKEYLIINDKEILQESATNEFFDKIQKVASGYPIQYITNKQEFMKMNFYVDENVLIPQPDTEILVEEVIKKFNNKSNLKILDLCTGSGAIAISLAKYIKNAEVIASDISEEALKIASKNAIKNNVKISLVKSNMFENIFQTFDIIVSNPPYIDKKTLKMLPADVKCEPEIALDGGEDGLDFYRIIAENAHRYLQKGGYIFLEIGFNQKNDVINILEKQNKFKNIKCVKDFANNDRVIIAELL